ncbi:MAG: OsmC family protein [Deferrisomatales bacterium]|nr:OsmC family protein [Deferrisomatales bacterium]
MGVHVVSRENLQIELTAGRHRWLADEPAGVGDDTGPNPYQLLLGALGACTAMTVQMYARRKGWPLDAVEVELDTHKIHARDCKDCESDPDTRVDIIELQLTLRGKLTPEQLHRLEEIAGRCPVHRTLTTETKIRARLVPAAG